MKLKKINDPTLGAEKLGSTRDHRVIYRIGGTLFTFAAHGQKLIPLKGEEFPIPEDAPAEAIIYRRTSTGVQQASLEVQESGAIAYAAVQDMTIVETIADSDTSGSIPMREREGGSRLIARLQEWRAAGRNVTVIALKQDRLGRDTVDQVNTIRLLWSLGLTPHLALEGGAIPRNPQTELVYSVKAATNQYERDQIRERITRAFALKKANGEAVSHPPYGWSLEPTGQRNPKTGRSIMRLIPHPEEAEWVRSMWRWWKEFNLTFHQIAAELNRRNVPTKIPKGTPMKWKNRRTKLIYTQPHSGLWRCGNVQGVLTNPHTLRLVAEEPAAQAA